jgi:hypothetical protein
MPRLSALLLLGAFCAASIPAAEAREVRRAPAVRHVPIEHDLRRLDRLDSRLIRNGFIPVSRLEGPSGRYPIARDPSGVTGFSGPPGIIGDSVNSLSPLPPGSPANLDGQLY